MAGAFSPTAFRAGAILQRQLLSSPAPARQSIAAHLKVQQRLCRTASCNRAFSVSLRRCVGESPSEASAKNQEQFEEDEKVTRRNAQKLVDDRPWHREDSHSGLASTSADPEGSDKTKGRLLTTPTRLLKLILPMPFHPQQKYINDENQSLGMEGKTVEPLALLVHPQQPLSYLERLIQAEIPPLLDNNVERLPDVAFRAEADHEENRENKKSETGDNVASYSGLGREAPDKSDGTKVNWVRWSGSTEVGDFIRDAARGKEFALVIEGYPTELRVAVPSFKDRTHYMRLRLRRISREIEELSKIKEECDQLAHKGAHRIAQGGFGALATWWGIVYYVTFHTDAGWDLVEPVTYLAGLTTIMGGYLWFLYISRDLSYKAAMNMTVSRRQNALYQERGFDVGTWDHLVHEGNHLRSEIKSVASEYDVVWNEMKDLGGEEVKNVLEKEQKKSKKKSGEEEDEDKQEAAKEAEKSEDKATSDKQS